MWKIPPGDLNLDLCPPHPTSTYTCGATIASMVYSGIKSYGRIVTTVKMKTLKALINRISTTYHIIDQ